MHPDRVTDLYRRYGPAIYARCRGLLADESAAEDATQETFLRVCRHLDKVPTEREGLFWIYRVATNYCLNQLRDRKGQAAARRDLPELVEELGTSEARLVDRDLMWRLIARAGAKLRGVAWLYHVDGFEQEEIASILGLSRRTVAGRLAVFLSNSRKFIRRSAA